MPRRTRTTRTGPTRAAVFVIVSSLALAQACRSQPEIAPMPSFPIFAPCPDSPNCVSSQAPDPRHRVQPFHLALPAQQAWAMVQATVNGMKRTTVVASTADYLRAECRSAVFRFVDDLELQLHPDQGIIAVRSASRTGYSDLGVNRRRVEKLRAELVRAGVLHPQTP